MCSPASLIITRDKVFWSRKTDSHDEIMWEFGLNDEVAGKITLVKVEITPPNGNMRIPIEQWQYQVDQDLLPDWYEKNPDKHEKNARAALQDWHDAKVFLSGYHEIRDGQCWAYGSSQVMAYDSSQVTACDSSQVTAYDSSQVTAYGSSQVTAYGSSQVKAYGSSQVTAYGSSQVNAYNSSQVKACDSSQVKAYGSSNGVIYGGKSYDLSGNAAAIDRRGDKIKLLVAKQ
jgi:hypothetical protein